MRILNRITERVSERLGVPVPRLLKEAEGKGPDFICVGAEKGGTRWLFDQLNHHPDFWMPPIKEIHYFDGVSERRLRKWRRLRDRRSSEHKLRSLDRRDRDFIQALVWLQLRGRDLSFYAKLFNPKGDRLSGDITPAYSLLHEEEINRIVASFPRAKIIYLARDPIGRVWSQYSMWMRRRGKGAPQTVQTLRQFLRTQSAIGHSRIAENVIRWRNATPAGNFGLFFFDDLVVDPVSLRTQIFQFIGGNPTKPSGDLPASFNSKVIKDKLVMTDRERTRLIKLHAREIRTCAEELGGPASEWPKLHGLS